MTLFGRTRVLLGSIRIFFDMDSSGRMRGSLISPCLESVTLAEGSRQQQNKEGQSEKIHTISTAYDMPFLLHVKSKEARGVSAPTCLSLGGNAPSEEKRGSAPQLGRGASGLGSSSTHDEQFGIFSV
jgi:hypothetical protein